VLIVAMFAPRVVLASRRCLQLSPRASVRTRRGRACSAARAARAALDGHPVVYHPDFQISPLPGARRGLMR
jgi:hypothetical protein